VGGDARPDSFTEFVHINLGLRKLVLQFLDAPVHSLRCVRALELFGCSRLEMRIRNLMLAHHLLHRVVVGVCGPQRRRWPEVGLVGDWLLAEHVVAFQVAQVVHREGVRDELFLRLPLDELFCGLVVARRLRLGLCAASAAPAHEAE